MKITYGVIHTAVKKIEENATANTRTGHFFLPVEFRKLTRKRVGQYLSKRANISEFQVLRGVRSRNPNEYMGQVPYKKKKNQSILNILFIKLLVKLCKEKKNVRCTYTFCLLEDFLGNQLNTQIQYLNKRLYKILQPKYPKHRSFIVTVEWLTERVVHNSAQSSRLCFDWDY